MPEPLGKITTNTQRTWQSDSTDSSKSSSIRFDLDDGDASPILVYKWGGDISTMSQKDLCDRLDHNVEYRNKRVTKKSIPRFTSNIEVKKHDLYNNTEQEEYKDYPNYNNSLAAIRIPLNVYLGRLVGNYSDLYIISPDRSPIGSESGGSSAQDSRKCSRDDDVAAENNRPADQE